MANEKNDAQQEQLSSDASKKNNNSKSGGGALIVLLCIVLIAAGTGLIYKDVSRNYRHGIYRCEDGRMMEEPAEPDSGKMRLAADYINGLAGSYPGVKQYMMLVPSAACIQSGYLPDGACIRDQRSDLLQIRGIMPQNLQWIDLMEVFSNHTGEKLYYASDIYLTGWGSRYAAKTAIEAMGAEIPEGKDKCYLLSNTFSGRLAKDKVPSLELFKNTPGERLEVYVPEEEASYYRVDADKGGWSGSLYDSAAAKGKDAYKVFFGGEKALTEIHTTAINGETLLVVGDRTADSIVPLFVSSFENIVLMHPSKCTRTIDSLIKKYNVTKVLYLYGANEFMTDRALLRSFRQ